MRRVYEPFVFVRRWFITKTKPFAEKEPFREGLVGISWQGCVVLKFTSQNEPARGPTISTRSQQLVRRKAFSHVHACDDQRIDAVPDAVLVLALPTNESETSQSQRRTRKERFACFSVRNDRAPYLTSKMHYVYKTTAKLWDDSNLARTTVSTWVAPAQWRLRSVNYGKVKPWMPDTVTSVAFFFFCMRTPRRTCVHVRKECSLEISVGVMVNHQKKPFFWRYTTPLVSPFATLFVYPNPDVTFCAGICLRCYTTNTCILIPKTIGNRKRDCAWGCARG